MIVLRHPATLKKARACGTMRHRLYRLNKADKEMFMKWFLKNALLICLGLSLAFLFACGSYNKTPADNDGQGQTVLTDGENGDETITVNGDNELPIILFN